MPGTGHTSIPRKKKAIVFLKNGSKIIGKFIKKADNKIYLDGLEPIPVKRVKTIAIYRDPNSLS